ncbi:MAG: hypothetical protein ABH834_07925 [Candidatus Altiarchaeota archaeon]
MHLTDSDLIWQGLSPQEYESLGSDSKGFVEGRAKAYRRVKSMKLVLDLVEAIRDDIGEGGADFAYAILSGGNKEASSVVKAILVDYMSEANGKTIKEFYRKKYHGSIIDLFEERLSSSNTISHHHRAVDIALVMSEWESRTPDKIMQAEMDVIEKIIKIADENKGIGITDREVTLAAEELVQDEFHEAQFHLEALQEDHREELLKRAVKLRR